ncbi:MAG: tetratricopeptide repeat protein [Candidatus Contendobacter sp.]|nr:tetratricopeptide repeat protein [Candidatus Contendobacter sp.]
MEQYTDDERVEDLKKWWKENGASILIGIALGVLAIFGWQYWRSWRDAQTEQISQAYEVFVAAAEKPDAEYARQRGQAVVTDFPKSPYAALAALRLAKQAMAGGDAAATVQQLNWVIANARLDEIKDIARLRLARAHLATGQLTEAGKLLDSVATASLNAEREELRGDVYLASNDPVKARTAYAAAMAAGGSQGLLQIKIDNLAAPTADMIVIAAPVPPPPEAQPEPAPAPAPAESASVLTEPATIEPASIESAPAPAEPAAVSTPAEPAAVSTPAEPAAVSTPAEPVATPLPPAPTSSGQ